MFVCWGLKSTETVFVCWGKTSTCLFVWGLTSTETVFAGAKHPHVCLIGRKVHRDHTHTVCYRQEQEVLIRGAFMSAFGKVQPYNYVCVCASHSSDVYYIHTVV